MLFILTLFIFAILTSAYYLKIKSKEGVGPNEGSIGDFSIALKLSHEKPQFSDVSEKEATEIEKTIDIFEKYKYKRDFVAAIKMLNPPENQDEKGWLNHLFGNDLAYLNNGNPSPRFFNKANYHLLVGYDTERIIKKGGAFYAYVRELRVLNVAEEGVSPKYEAKIQGLTFELVSNTKSYEISRYYHTNHSSTANLKYEGFVAF